MKRLPWRAPALVLVTILVACGAAPPHAGPVVPPIATVPPVSPGSPAPEPSPLPPVATKPPAVTSPPPAAPLPASLQGQEWTRLPTSRPVVALTFDGGSGAEGMPAILDTLSKEHVAATFFLTGRWCATNPALARRAAATGAHAIGNHTLDHPDLTRLSDDEVRAEVADGESWIHSAAGIQPRPLFRFPYGAVDQRTLAIVNAMGYGGIRWTVDTLGWQGSGGGQSVDSVVARAVGSAQPGEIVLMHVGAAPDGSTLDATALPRVIAELRQRGYGFVAVGDFLKS